MRQFCLLHIPNCYGNVCCNNKRCMDDCKLTYLICCCACCLVSALLVSFVNSTKIRGTYIPSCFTGIVMEKYIELQSILTYCSFIMLMFIRFRAINCLTVESDSGNNNKCSCKLCCHSLNKICTQKCITTHVDTPYNVFISHI